MSPTWQERVDNWKEWLAVAHETVKAVQPVGYEVVPVGFEHWCGSATLIHDWEDYDGECCSGCRSTIARPSSTTGDPPYMECEPLFSIRRHKISLTF